ncbi:MAG: hypothetical protein IPJ74_27420 [Saprospiraceae bacterium]|nr:hypothetical protein [Saprospiraceae bacterium]
MNRLFLFILVILSLFACKQESKNTASTAPTAPAVQLTTLSYPPLPADIATVIGTKGDHIDVLFYSMPISISRDGNPDVQQMLSHVSSEAPKQVAPCQAIGRIFFQAQGETLAEADLFLDENCNYYLFYVDGKPTYANFLTPDGVKLYENLTGPYRKR